MNDVYLHNSAVSRQQQLLLWLLLLLLLLAELFCCHTVVLVQRRIMWPITLSTTKDAFRCYLRPINLKAAALFNSSARRGQLLQKVWPGPSRARCGESGPQVYYYAIVISNGFIIVVVADVAVAVAVRLGPGCLDM